MIVGMWSVLPYAIGFAIMHLYEVYEVCQAKNYAFI